MKKLKLYPVSTVDELAWPTESSDISLQTAALEFFTDFNRIEPLVIEATVPAVDAKKMMIKTHVRLKLVVNKANNFLGVISAEDLTDRKIVQRVAAGIPREDISVTDLMTPKKNLLALGLDEVEKSSISGVIELLKDYHQQHCLVIDRDAHKIRGIFSASDISRKLRLPIDIQERSNFYRVFAAIG